MSSESTDVQFVALEEVAGLTMHESIRKRIRDYLSDESPALRLVAIDGYASSGYASR